MKNTPLSGQSGSTVLVSDDAKQFDPDSLLDDEQTRQSSELPVLVLLSLNSPKDLQVLGLFEGISVEKRSMTLHMTVLMPLATKLSIALLKNAKTMVSIKLIASEETSFVPQELVSVQFGSPLNNRVKMTVLFKSHEQQ
jgi:hypothetical protein